MASPLEQIKQIWSRLPMAGRVAVIGAAVVTLGLFGTIIYYGSQPDYAVLFADLKPADAQSIVEKLKAANVPYALANNGTTVQVPSERISELRLQMASEGALSGGHVGFDLFDKTSFGATDFAQQINYRRAIEGELGRTLEGMDEVESARVHITPKKESVFTEKEEGAKASVMLRVKQGKQLSAERTDAIVSLLSSSVEGLDPASVSVMDTRGRLMTTGRGGKSGAYNDAGLFQAQLEAKQKFETENAARVIAFLEPVIGEGRVRSDVAADIDFSQVEQTEEKYNPQSQVVRSQQSSTESRNSTSKVPTAVVGARSNDPTTPTAPATVTPAPIGADQRGATTTNYEIDKTVRRTVGGGGRINRMTVSVVVDSKNVNGVEVARQPDELKQIQDLVAAAVGVDEKRGDAVVVQTMAFSKPPVEDAAAVPFLDRYKSLVSSAIKYGALILIALLLLLFVIRPARRALKTAAVSGEPRQLNAGFDENERRAGDSETPRQIEANAPAGNALLSTVAEMEAKMLADLGNETAPLTKDAQRAQTMKKMIAEESLNNPEVVVSTLRGWLQEG
ncbi:MAG: flagellar M-ring protein FliF [Pyrinomonadaceae bacterium]|nr:flagellar M-ring protein FliF [Pyrinomonadaceae bacterium]